MGCFHTVKLMAEETVTTAKLSLSKVGTAIGVAVGIISICSSFAVFVIIPYRVTASEARIAAVEHDVRTDREALIRMEERIFSVQRELGIKADPPKKDH